MNPAAVDGQGRWLYGVGGIAGLVIGISYVVIIGLYLAAGVPPDGGAAWLAYGAGKTAPWWGILSLSVLTDVLIVPLMLALYVTLRGVARDLMLLAVAFKVLFVVLELSVGWPNIGLLITYSGDYAAAATQAERAALVTGADYAATVYGSTLAGVYSILLPAVGMLLAGLAMRRSVFGRGAVYAAVLSGVLGIVSVAGGFFVAELGEVVILASIFSLAWYFLVGYRLARLAQARA
jgi:hypothetical protein